MLRVPRQRTREGAVMEQLSEILWRERELLDMLLYKLEQQQLILTVGRTEWLGTAAGEIEAVALLVRQTETRRIVVHGAVACELGLPSTASLAQLAARADEPWTSILCDHRDSLAASSARIADLVTVNRRMLATGANVARELLLAVAAEGEPVNTEDVAGPGAPLATTPQASR